MTKYFLQRTKAVVNTFFLRIKAIVITWFVVNNVTSYEEVKQPNTFYDELRPLLIHFLTNKSLCNYLVCRRQCNFIQGSQTTKYFL